MKFSIVKEKFLEPLADISGIVARKTTKPILSHALLQAGADNSLLLKGTDTEVTLQILLHELNVQDAGAITVPAAKLLDVVRHLPAQATIYCSLEKEQLLVKAAGSLFRIATLPAEDFPALAEADMERRIETESRALHDIMQKVRFSMASEDVRYYLNGMYLNIVEDGNAIHAVSTDGHRLSCARSALATPAPAGTNLIVPKKGVSELIKLLGRVSQPVVLNLGERQLSLTLGGYRLTSQLIDGTFPNYEQVLPPLQETPVLISRQTFLESLQRAKVLLLDRHDGIRLTFGEASLQLAARNLENETADETLEIINPQNLQLEVALNINYLIDAIATISGDNVQLHIADGSSPCLITSSDDEGVRYVIMPMRL
jgi:DNA polymerase III, beta subunit